MSSTANPTPSSSSSAGRGSSQSGPPGPSPSSADLVAKAAAWKVASKGLDPGTLAYNAVPKLTKAMSLQLWEINLKNAFKVMGLLFYLADEGIPDGYDRDTVFKEDEAAAVEDPGSLGDPMLAGFMLARQLLMEKIQYELLEEMINDGLSVTASAFRIFIKTKEYTQKFNKLAVGKVYDDWNRMTRVDYGNTKDFVQDLHSTFNKLNGSGMGLSTTALAYRLIWGFRRFDQAKADAMENDFVMEIRTCDDLLRELRGLGEKEQHEQASQGIGAPSNKKRFPSKKQPQVTKPSEPWDPCASCNTKHPRNLHKCKTCNSYHRKTTQCPEKCSKCSLRHFRHCTSAYNKFEYLNKPPTTQQSTTQASASVFASEGRTQDSVFGNSGIEWDIDQQSEAFVDALSAQARKRTLPLFPVEDFGVSGPYFDPQPLAKDPCEITHMQGVEKQPMKTPEHSVCSSAGQTTETETDSLFTCGAIEEANEEENDGWEAQPRQYVMSTASIRRTDSFMLDTGASRHILNDLSIFEELRDLPQGLTMNCVGRKDQIGQAVGTARVIATKPGVQIISTGLLRKMGIHFNGLDDTLVHKDTSEAVANFKWDMQVPWLQIHPSNWGDEFGSLGLDYQTFHARLGHPSREATIATARDTNVNLFRVPPIGYKCHICLMAKSTQQPGNRRREQPTWAFQRLWIDFLEPTPQGFGGVTCGLHITEAFSTYRWFQAFKSKKDAAVWLRSWFLKKIAATNGIVHFSEVIMDNDTALLKVMEPFAQEQGFILETAAPHSHQQNGGAEGSGRAIQQKARAMCIEAGLPESFWPWSMKTSTEVGNLLSDSKGNISPHEKLANALNTSPATRKPYIRHLRRWGCRAYVHIHPDSHLYVKGRKMRPRAELGRFMGYDSLHGNVFHILIERTNSIRRARDVTFKEDEGELPLVEFDDLWPGEEVKPETYEYGNKLPTTTHEAESQPCDSNTGSHHRVHSAEQEPPQEKADNLYPEEAQESEGNDEQEWEDEPPQEQEEVSRKGGGTINTRRRFSSTPIFSCCSSESEFSRHPSPATEFPYCITTARIPCCFPPNTSTNTRKTKGKTKGQWQRLCSHKITKSNCFFFRSNNPDTQNPGTI
ncbi:hypothetical protein CGLO_18322 [Colletotrichum gloeosporioides Cg-14]|uniref:Integrase catalytic domain-containing protein n=1 Tax=Colletotrichum gloeosporioides (strain Cg-14) TaxID=1237896 RepID=T0L4E4_COLGC|nr:hypothetical protein CGLO_18322 [Colletotrichum gloeosporioides Cg-14]